MDVTFAFKPNQAVETPFGDHGIVTMCAVDDNETKTYCVKSATTTQWFKETELRFRAA